MAVGPYSKISSVADPLTEFRAVTPSDVTDLAITDSVTGAKRYPRAIYAGGAGNLAITGMEDSAAVTLTAFPVGVWAWIRPKLVMATNTTSTLIIAGY